MAVIVAGGIVVGRPVGGVAAEEPDPIVPAAKVALFNGVDYTGWVKFIPDAGVDVDRVWTVRDGVMHCLGKPNGYIRTEKPYRDYRLHLEWRWPGEPTNSGVLLHAQLPDRVWPKTVEAQVQHRNAGDFWLLSFSTIQDRDGKTIGPEQYANLPKRQESSEKAPGEWNVYEIVCDGDTVRLMVNGVLQNEGFKADPSAGYICLQSEGSPIEFRNIHLEPLAR
jgi:hypothetical protein